MARQIKRVSWCSLALCSMPQHQPTNQPSLSSTVSLLLSKIVALALCCTSRCMLYIECMFAMFQPKKKTIIVCSQSMNNQCTLNMYGYI